MPGRCVCRPRYRGSDAFCSFIISVESGKGRVAGFFAALILASCLHFTWLARIGRIDMPLTFAVTLACGGFYLGMTQPRERRWYLLGYISVARGNTIERPDCPAVQRRNHRDRRLLATAVGANVARSCCFALVGAAAGCADCCPVVYLGELADQQPSLGSVFLVPQSRTRPGRVGDVGLSSILVLLAPYSHRFVALEHRAAAGGLVFLHARRAGDETRKLNFGVVWFLVIFGFLSCMSFKRADYLLPAYPGAALFLGCWAERMPLSGAVKRGSA